MVKGEEREGGEEDPKSVFSGSVSDLRKPKPAAHPIIQFVFSREPHWCFVLFFAHLLFWMRVRRPRPRACHPGGRVHIRDSS